MIKLKQILSEYANTGELPFPVNDLYSFFNRATVPLKRVKLARMMIGLHGKHLSPAHVYHIILGLPREYVLNMYDYAQKRLSPEQLADTAKQIELFHRPHRPEFSQAAE